MRLRRLLIHRYGHFADAALEFPGNGVQVVHGRNEAGKSTLLQFLREVLFGFGERNRYGFLGEKLQGSTLMEFADGRIAELRRRSGRPDALTLTRGELPESTTEAELQALLGGANGPLFQGVFAFGLPELAAGEASLKIDAVQNSLHGSGLSGLANPQKMLDQLTKESEALFKEKGSKQDVAKICSDIKALGTQLKETITRPETYLQRKRDHDAAQTDAERLAAQLGLLRREQAHVKKLATAYPLWRELTDLQEQRHQLGAPSPLTVDSRARFDKLLDELKRLVRETAKLEREIQTAESELQKNPAQTEWLELRSQIEQARELIISVQEARRDLPLLVTELHSDNQQVSRGIEDVISTWSIGQLEAFRCDAGQRGRCEQLAETKRELDNERSRLEEREARLTQEQVANQADLNSLGVPADVTALQALLNQHADQVARETDLARLLKEEGKQLRAITTQTRKLSPPLPPDVPQIEALPVPPNEQIKHYQSLFSEARKRITVAEQSQSEARERREQIERELTAARGSLTEIPTSDGLKQIRAHRDAGWDLIERRFISAQPAPTDEEARFSKSPESLPADFERTLHVADDYADRMFSNASLVHQQEQVDIAGQTVAAKQEDLEARRQAFTTLEGQWRDLWQPCGFEPFDPDTMSAWKAQHDQLLDTLAKQSDLKEDIARLQGDIAAFNDRLAAVLPDLQGRTAERLAAAQERVSDHQQQVQDLKTFQRQAAKLQKGAAQLRDDRHAFEARRQAFIEQWQSWLATLQFPADWQPELALTVVGRLQALRDKLQRIPALESRIRAMRQRLAEFDPFVTTLCEQVAPEWKAQATEVAARHLADRLQSALDTDSRRANLTRELLKHRNKLDEIKEQQQSQRDEHRRLLELAQAATDEAFLTEANRAEALRDIDGQIVAKQRELARLRDFQDETTFLTELQAVDFSALEASRQSLVQQIKLLEDEERGANERKGATGKELELLDGSAAAADIQATITQRRAALANAIDRYVPLLFARQLLQETLQRFEKESQPEMLNEVSRLFADMTDGRYQRVERPRDPSRPLIVYRTGTSDVLEPGELSAGTREQLYLAIRLAYVLHYCTKAEPLPIVLDDVFANFDPGRTRRSLEALGRISDRVQVLLFTCHPHVVALAQEVFPDLQPVEVPNQKGDQKGVRTL